MTATYSVSTLDRMSIVNNPLLRQPWVFLGRPPPPPGINIFSTDTLTTHDPPGIIGYQHRKFQNDRSSRTVKIVETVISRSYAESEIKFTCNVKKQLLTLRNQLNQDCGKVKKVRGLAYGFRVSPQMLNRMITSAKGVFLPLLSDVFITNDQVRGSKSKTPGFGVVLHALTTRGISYSADGFIGRDNEDGTGLSTVSSQNLSFESKKRKFDLFPEDESNPNSDFDSSKKKRQKRDLNESSDELKTKPGTLTGPEELGTQVANLLIREISTRSCVDSVFQWLVVGYMALGPKDITSVSLGLLTPFTVQYLRDLRTFFGVTFKIEKQRNVENESESEGEDSPEGKTGDLYKLSCVGTGYMNFNKTMV